MILKRHHSIAASALLLASGLFGHVAPVHAGDVSNAQLGCYIDTYAFDYPTYEYCAGYWTPYSADNPTTAVFEVDGLPPGNYSFIWTDLGTGQTGVCYSAFSSCFRSIRLNRSVTLSVIVTDTQTGASKTLIAAATFWDAYN